MDHVMNISTDDLAGLTGEDLASYIERVVEAKVEARIDEVVAERRAEAPQAKAPAPLWTILKVADYLGVSRRQVDKYLASGELSSIKVGNQHRFEPKAVERAARGGLSAMK
jgi:excisionase family DNA binding protein